MKAGKNMEVTEISNNEKIEKPEDIKTEDFKTEEVKTEEEEEEENYKLSKVEFKLHMNILIEKIKQFLNDAEAYYDSKGKPVATIYIRPQKQKPKVAENATNLTTTDQNETELTGLTELTELTDVTDQTEITDIDAPGEVVDSQRSQRRLIPRPELKQQLANDKLNLVGELKKLKKYFSSSMDKTRLSTQIVTYFSDNLKQFFIEFFESTDDIKIADLPMFSQNMSYSSTLLSLFTLYGKRRNLQSTELGKKHIYYGDDLLKKYFAKNFERIAAKGITKDKRGKSYDAQSSNEFRYTSFRVLMADESTKKIHQTPNQIEMAQNPDIRNLLKQEYDIISVILEAEKKKRGDSAPKKNTKNR